MHYSAVHDRITRILMSAALALTAVPLAALGMLATPSVAHAATSQISVTAPVAVTFGGSEGYDVANPQLYVESSVTFSNCSATNAIRLAGISCSEHSSGSVDAILDAKSGAPALTLQNLFSLYPTNASDSAVSFGCRSSSTVDSATLGKTFAIAPFCTLPCTFRLNLGDAVVASGAADSATSWQGLAKVTYTFGPIDADDYDGFLFADKTNGKLYTASQLAEITDDISKNPRGANALHFESLMKTENYICRVKLQDGYTYNAIILGVNHDALSDGSGNAGLTFQFMQQLSSKLPMSNNTTYNWSSSEIRSLLNSTDFYYAISDDLWQNIKEVRKSYVINGEEAPGTVDTVDDCIFVPSSCEIFGSVLDKDSTYTWLVREGSQYEYFRYKDVKDGSYFLNDCLNRPTIDSGTLDSLWCTRSPMEHGARYVYWIGRGGYRTGGVCTNDVGVAPCFCM